MRNSLKVQPNEYLGDVTGRPLDYGMVWFGQPNKDPEFYPIDIFYDAELTLPAAQPVRTKGGYLNGNGDIVEIYAAQNEYSVKVLDSYGRKVFYRPKVTTISNATGTIENNIKLPFFGAVDRTLIERSMDSVTVKDFGAKGDGVTDDTLAIQACTDAVGVVRFPEGSYLISDTIVQKFSGQKFIGAGVNPYNDSTEGATRIIMSNSAKSIFKTSQTGFSATALNLTYQNRPSRGCAFDIQHSGSFIHEVWIDKCWRGFAYSRNTGHALSNCNVQSAYYAAFSVDGTNDIAVNNCIFVSADLNVADLDKRTTCEKGVVLFENYVQAVQMTNVDILGGAKSIGFSNAAPNDADIKTYAAFCKFTNVYFDSSFYGADVNKCVGMTFVNCWFSNRPGDGCVIGSDFTDNIKFIGCNFENNGGSGVVLKKGANNTTFTECSFLGNSTTSPGGSHGMYVDTDANNFTLIGCIARNVDYYGNNTSQNFGLLINGGNTSAFRLIGNDFSGNNNPAGYVIGSKTNAETVVALNKPQKSDDAITLNVDSSPFQYKNQSGTPQVVAVKSGTVSSIELFGSPVYTSTNQCFVLSNGQAFKLFYSQKPTIVVNNML